MPGYDDSHIEIKSKSEIESMRVSGQILDEILCELMEMAKPGISTWDLEKRARQLFKERSVTPAFLGYRDYPAALCTSINHEVVHGIPSPQRFVKSGDLLKIDAGVFHNGFYADAARTIPVGEVDDVSQKLIDVAKKALFAGVNMMQSGNRLGDISRKIQEVVEFAGFSVVREYTGHGIGRRLHESPQIPNFGKAGTGPRLREGMVFALEPMVNAGVWETEVMEDEWTVVTVDRKRSAHFEHTVALEPDGPCILTQA